MKNPKLIPYAIIALVLVFILLDLFFLILSTYTFTGLYAEIANKSAFNYQQILDVKEKNATPITTKTSFSNNTITVIAQNIKNQPITGASAHVKILRNVTTKNDQTIKLEEIHPGIYSAKIKPLELGKWNIRVKIEFEGTEAIYTKRITVSR